MNKNRYSFLLFFVLFGLFASSHAQITIVNPISTAEYLEGGDITIEASVTNDIEKVRFYSGSTLLGEDSISPFRIIWPHVFAGTYTVSAKGLNEAEEVMALSSVTIAVEQGCTGFGSISHDVFNNLGGARVSVLLAYPRFPDNPSFRSKRSSFEGDPNSGDNYGVRMYGYVCPPTTGEYVFYIAADDRAELWLSTDDNSANKLLIASVNEPVASHDYSVYPEQKSVPIALTKATKYYIEALHKESSKSDHLSVAWKMPNGVTEDPIPGNRLWPVFTRPTPTGIETEATPLSYSKINVFPTPASKEATVQFLSVASGKAELVVTDALSNETMKYSIEAKTGRNETKLPLEGLKSGMYFVHLLSGKEHLTYKLIVK